MDENVNPNSSAFDISTTFFTVLKDRESAHREKVCGERISKREKMSERRGKKEEREKFF